MFEPRWKTRVEPQYDEEDRQMVLVVMEYPYETPLEITVSREEVVDMIGKLTEMVNKFDGAE